jgi:hypothetical protein
MDDSQTLVRAKFQIPEKKEIPLYPRQEIIKMFVDRLNNERGEGYKPLGASFIASKMYQAGLKDEVDLWWFWGFCRDASHFSKCWWFSLKWKKEA